MSSWSKSTPPIWFPTAVATMHGWEDPISHEILVSVPQGALLDTPAHLTVIFADKPYYVPGGTITFAVYFSKAVTVTGTPQLVVQIGENARTVDYTSGSGTNILLFDWTIASDDRCSSGAMTVTALNLNGGTITDVASDITVFSPSVFLGVRPHVGGVIQPELRSHYPANMHHVWLGIVAVLGFDPLLVTQYYINPATGNDGNTGLSPDMAWATTEHADAFPDAVDQVIWLRINNGWQLYRMHNMTVQDTDLTVDDMTGTANSY